MRVKFIGGTRDGQTRYNVHPGAKFVLFPLGKDADGNYKVEKYARDRDNYERDAEGEVTTIAYKFVDEETFNPSEDV